MRDAWEGPVMRYFPVIGLLVPLGLIPIVAYILEPVHETMTITAICIGACYLAFFTWILITRRELVELWNSNRKFISVGSQEARPRLEAAFAASGLSYRVVTPSKLSDDIKYELGGGFSAKLLQSQGKNKCVIYVWPVNDRTRRDIDGLKRRIDAAFPPAR